MMIMFASEGHLVIGLTQGNIDRLLARRPAHLLGPHPMQVQAITVLYGVDKLDIVAQLEAAGVEFAQAMKDGVAEDPT